MPAKVHRLADVIEETESMRGPQSMVDVALAKLEKHPDLEEVKTILHSPAFKWPHTRTAKILSKLSDMKVTSGSVENWRKRNVE